MAVANDFQRNALKRDLKEISINDEQRTALEEYYTNDPRSYDLIKKELVELKKDNKKLLDDVLKKAAENKTGIKLDNVEEKKEDHVELSLEHISEFTKDNEFYIKIHYPYPYDEVKIIKNTTGQSAEQLFRSAGNAQKIMSNDGTKNATSIFEQLFEKSTEVKMKEAKDFTHKEEFNKLSVEEAKVLRGTIITMVHNMPISTEDQDRLLDKNRPLEEILQALNKKIWISVSTEYNPVTLQSNIVTICDENTYENDKVDTLREEDKFVLQSLNNPGTSISSRSLNTKEISSQNSNLSNKSDILDEPTKGELIELGPVFTKKPKYNKNKKDAAFISVVSLLIIGSVILGIISASLIKLYLK